MEPEFALRMEPDINVERVQDITASMEPEFALRMERRGQTRNFHVHHASMEPEFALRMEPGGAMIEEGVAVLQWSRSLHSGWN